MYNKIVIYYSNNKWQDIVTCFRSLLPYNLKKKANIIQTIKYFIKIYIYKYIFKSFPRNLYYIQTPSIV